MLPPPPSSHNFFEGVIKNACEFLLRNIKVYSPLSFSSCSIHHGKWIHVFDIGFINVLFIPRTFSFSRNHSFILSSSIHPFILSSSIHSFILYPSFHPLIIYPFFHPLYILSPSIHPFILSSSIHSFILYTFFHPLYILSSSIHSFIFYTFSHPLYILSFSIHPSFHPCKVIMEGKLIAVAYTLRIHIETSSISLGGIFKQE